MPPRVISPILWFRLLPTIFSDGPLPAITSRIFSTPFRTKYFVIRADQSGNRYGESSYAAVACNSGIQGRKKFEEILIALIPSNYNLRKVLIAEISWIISHVTSVLHSHYRYRIAPDLLVNVCMFFEDNEVNISQLSADNYFKGERHAILVESVVFSALNAAGYKFRVSQNDCFDELPEKRFIGAPFRTVCRTINIRLMNTDETFNCVQVFPESTNVKDSRFRSGRR